MKKIFQHYAIIWLLILIAFNVVLFVSPLAGLKNFNDTFWTGYVLITLAFLGQIFGALFSGGDLEKIFFSLTMLRAVRVGFIALCAAGAACMFIPALPMWSGMILCAGALSFAAFIILQARGALAAASDVERRMKAKTLFIRSLTLDAENLLSRTTNPDIKSKVKEVRDAIRYSDPMSHDTLSALEAQITLRFADLSAADDSEKAAASAQELLSLLAERNKKCKLLK